MTPELWAGPEASVVRVGDRRTDQLASTGFAGRLDDLDRLAELGVTRLRMPVLWERTETTSRDLDFAWADARLERLRALGIEPIVGLLHHGSGPLHTHLLDPAFPSLLAGYARRVAERYPWVRLWTPVNEPLTTARFSGLYGLWFPHRRDDASFVRALLNQVDGTRRAMAQIRGVTGEAGLVQTEDLGHTQGTEPLADQVRFENERRWLGLDLLHGRVDAVHPLHGYLLRAGATPAELDALRASPELPAVTGINHYVTSDRFLDHRLAHYPPHLHGGNGRQAYADVEAVRVKGSAVAGFEACLREAAARYPGALALTEVQLGCTREEQLRWFAEAWRAAARLAAEGLPVQAVTAWATFGAHDWDSLLVQARGHYEPGLFDTRGGTARPTATARLVRELAQGHEPSHPVLHAPGWWRRPERHLYPPDAAPPPARRADGPPILVTGARGTLAQACARLCEERGLACRLLDRDELDIADPASVAAALARWSPWAVVNTAGFVRVDDAETDPRQWRENARGPAVLAQACGRRGVRLLTYSSDLVFDGRRRSRPYRESDAARPLNAYGSAKLLAEQAVQGHDHVLVVRTAAFFGPWDRHNFLTCGLQALHRGDAWHAIGDQTVSPTYVPDLVHASLDLLIDGERGLWHVANHGEASWYELACRAAEAAGLPRAPIVRVAAAQAGQRARRPRYSALASERGALMPSLDAALSRFVEQARA